MNNPLLYLAAVYGAFHDEPEKFDEFMKLSEDATAYSGANEGRCVRRMRKLFQGHQYLSNALYTFFPTSRGAVQNGHRVDKASGIAKGKEVPKPKTTIPPNQNRANSTLPPKKRTLTPKAKRAFVPVDSMPDAKRLRSGPTVRKIPIQANAAAISEDNLYPKARETNPTEAKHRDSPKSYSERWEIAKKFTIKLQTRFRSIGEFHVYESYVEIMKKFLARKKSGYKVVKEVCLLFCDHQDLVDEFLYLSENL